MSLFDCIFFDKHYYLDSNSDVKRSGLDAKEHYLRFGKMEGRAPSLYCAKERNSCLYAFRLDEKLFSEKWYLFNYPDVAKAGINPLVHYVKNGRQEGRFPNEFYKRSINPFHIWFQRERANLILKEISDIPLKLYFDHDLGGGANVYYNIRTTNEDNILRVQQAIQPRKFKLTFKLKGRESTLELNIYSVKQLYKFLEKLNLESIIINNLVSFDALAILNVIERLKAHCKDITYLCHEYHALCPSYTLMDCNMQFCNGCTDVSICSKCFPKLCLSDNPITHKLLLSGAKNISEWRKKFSHFLQNVATSLVTFDLSVADMFCKYYPELSKKITNIPHLVPPLRKANITPSEDIVICTIGSITSVAKGEEVMRLLDKQLDGQNGVRCIMIGRSKGELKNIVSTGPYERDSLPELLERHHADIVFIPSVCAETFSYTTSEVMMMGLPLACFNFGAQARRTRNYEKGYILDYARKETLLSQLIDAVEDCRNNF